MPARAIATLLRGAPDMDLSPLHRLIIEPIVRAALLEDLGLAGDITSNAVIAAEAVSPMKYACGFRMFMAMAEPITHSIAKMKTFPRPQITAPRGTTEDLRNQFPDLP